MNKNIKSSIEDRRVIVLHFELEKSRLNYIINNKLNTENRTRSNFPNFVEYTSTEHRTASLLCLNYQIIRLGTKVGSKLGLRYHISVSFALISIEKIEIQCVLSVININFTNLKNSTPTLKHVKKI